MPLKTTKFDVQDYLKTPDQQAAYLEAALESDDPSFIAAAIGDLARSFEVLPRDWTEPRSDLQDVSRGRQSNARYTEQGYGRSWLQTNACAEGADRWLVGNWSPKRPARYCRQGEEARLRGEADPFTAEYRSRLR